LINFRENKIISILKIKIETIYPSKLNTLLTMKELKFLILDARHQYEYESGHIKGAINISSFGAFQKLFQDYSGTADYVIVYCEHSLYQGPLLINSIFKYDEKENPNKRLFSNIFLLYGGYSTFFRRYKIHCQGKYVSELEISSKLELIKHDQLVNEMHLKVNENET
jgi:hypothetical protein